jgi:hypothetical protein
MVRAPRTIVDYDALIDPLRAAREGRSGKQLGDPAKAARAILKVVQTGNPPAHLLLGPDAVKAVRDKLAALEAEIADSEAISMSTNFE